MTGFFATIGAVLNGWHKPNLPSSSLGYFDLANIAAMLPTIMISSPLGVRVGNMLNETWLRRIYAALLFVVALDLLRRLIV